MFQPISPSHGSPPTERERHFQSRLELDAVAHRLAGQDYVLDHRQLRFTGNDRSSAPQPNLLRNRIMRAFEADDDGITELGEISPEQLPEFLTKATEKNRSIKSDYYSVGLSRSDDDYLEICPITESVYLILSDIIVKQQGFIGLLKALFGPRHIEHIVEIREEALEIALFYMQNSREDFERKYGPS